MHQQELFPAMAEVAHFHASFVRHVGWHIHVAIRREGQEWADTVPEEFSALSSEEAAQVIAAVALTAFLD